MYSSKCAPPIASVGSFCEQVFLEVEQAMQAGGQLIPAKLRKYAAGLSTLLLDSCKTTAEVQALLAPIDLDDSNKVWRIHHYIHVSCCARTIALRQVQEIYVVLKPYNRSLAMGVSGLYN